MTDRAGHWHRIRLEFRLAAAGGTVAWVLATSLVLAAVAGYTGWRWQRFRVATVAAVGAQAHERAGTWMTDAERHVAGTLDPQYVPPDRPYFVYAFFPQYAIARPAPLGGLSVGQSDLFAYYAEWNGVSGNVLFHEEEIQNPSVLALGRLDPAFWVAIILPVLLIALTHDLVAEDRRTGRDRLLRLQLGSLWPIMVLRLVLRLACVGVVVVAMLGVTMAFSAATVGALPAVGDVVPLLLTVGGYIAFWGAVAAVVNARGDSVPRNGVLLLAVWSTLALLAPGAIDGLARRLVPIPPEATSPTVERRILQGITDSAALARLARLEPLSPPSSPTVATERRWVAGAEVRRDTTETRRALVREALRRRERVADRLSLVVPPLAMHGVFSEFAGTTGRHALAFERAVAEARRARGVATRRFALDGVSPSLADIERLADSALLQVDDRAGAGRARAWTTVGALWLLAAMLLAASRRVLRTG